MPHIIAEACTNHNGSLAKARELVDLAVTAGADSVKFQIINPEGLYLLRVRDEQGAWADNGVVAQRRAAMLTDDEYRELAAYAGEKGLPFSGSIFDRKSLDLLDELNAPYLKIASTDCNNYPFLAEAAARGRRLILSTGMASLGEVERAVQTITGQGNQDLVLLHCVSVYPCPLELTNLTFIQTLRTTFGFPVGFSDHTSDHTAAAIAIALGAEWLEKHYTWDRTAPGFDHANSLDPAQLASYVASARAATTALQRPAAKTSEKEGGVRARARRALHAARDLQPGETITAADVLIVRPTGPLAPGDLELILGRTLKQPIQQFEAFSLAHLA
jgi:sialic acid synthase SpsE